MTKTKKPRCTAGTVKRETEQAGQKPYSTANCNTDEKKKQDFFIASMLPRGSENAVTTAELLRRTGYRSKRLMTKQIEAERRAGALILSKYDADGGYYRPGSRAELENFVHSMDHRARAIMYTIKTARAALKAMDEGAL